MLSNEIYSYKVPFLTTATQTLTNYFNASSDRKAPKTSGLINEVKISTLSLRNINVIFNA